MRLSSIRHEAVFAVTMVAASSLGLLKAFGLAALLSAEGFGYYISALGIATLLGITASFGLVETTIKLYPGLYAAGRMAGILSDASRVLRVMALRIIPLGAVLAGGLLWVGDGAVWGFGARDVTLIFVGAWAISALTVVASIVRAMIQTRVLLTFTVVRGAFPLSLALPAGVSLGWQAAFAAEIVAMGIVLVATRLFLRRHKPAAPSEVPTATQDDAEVKKGGWSIYLANLVAASIPYGGRTAVLALAGPVAAGAFGLATLIVQMGLMLANALSQKLGPRMIRDAAQGQLDARAMGPGIVLMTACSIGGTALLAASWLVPAFEAFWTQKALTPLAVVLVGLHLFMPVYQFVTFFLISRHEEGRLIVASSLAAGCFYTGLVLSWWTQAGPTGYIAAALAADALRLGYLARLARRAPSTKAV